MVYKKQRKNQPKVGIVHAEARLKAACFGWFWNTLVEYRGQLFRIKNENRHAENPILGIVPGVSDFLFVGRGFVVFIELKTEKGIQSDAQIDFERIVTDYGHRYEVIRTVEKFKKLILCLIEL